MQTRNWMPLRMHISRQHASLLTPSLTHKFSQSRPSCTIRSQPGKSSSKNLRGNLKWVRRRRIWHFFQFQRVETETSDETIERYEAIIEKCAQQGVNLDAHMMERMILSQPNERYTYLKKSYLTVRLSKISSRSSSPCVMTMLNTRRIMLLLSPALQPSQMQSS